MKSATILSTLFLTSAFALEFPKFRLLNRGQHYSNNSLTAHDSTDDSTVTQVYTPTSTLTQYLTVTVTVPTVSVSASALTTNTVVTSAYETTLSDGHVSDVTFTTTQDITKTLYMTVTNTITKTITAPSDSVREVIDSVVKLGGIAAVDSTVVSKLEKTLTLTHPIYITVAAEPTGTASGTPNVISSNEIDTITITSIITKIIQEPNIQTVTSNPFANKTAPLVTTYILTDTTTALTTINHKVTSTVTNFITVTNTAAGVVETKASTNQFVYNSEETVTLTPTKTITQVITLTTTAVEETKTSTVYHTYLYTVTETNQGKTSTVERTAVDTETSTWTKTNTITVPAPTSTKYITIPHTFTVSNSVYTTNSVVESAVIPTFVTVTNTGAWNGSSIGASTGGPAKRHIHRRLALKY